MKDRFLRSITGRRGDEPYYQEFVEFNGRAPHKDAEPEKNAGRQLQSLPAGSCSVRIAGVLATLRGVLSTEIPIEYSDMYSVNRKSITTSAPLV